VSFGLIAPTSSTNPPYFVYPCLAYRSNRGAFAVVCFVHPKSARTTTANTRMYLHTYVCTYVCITIPAEFLCSPIVVAHLRGVRECGWAGGEGEVDR